MPKLYPDGAPGDAPDPDVRRRMVEDAFRNSPLLANFKKATELTTAEEQAQHALEALTKKIFDTCASVKRLAEGPYDEFAMQALVMRMWKDALGGFSKDDLHFMLCLEQTGLMMQALEEVN